MTDRSWLHEHPEPGMRPNAIAADEARYERRRAEAEDPPPLDDRPTRAELAAEEWQPDEPDSDDADAVE